MIHLFIFILLWSRCLCSPQRPTKWHGRLSTNTNAKQVAACGDSTTVDQNPWAAILYFNNEFRCGATILGHELVITAAHCVSGKSNHRMILYYGRTYLADSEIEDKKAHEIYREFGGRTRILEIRIHPKYSQFKKFKGNDIALLKVEWISYSDYVRPIKVVPTLPKYEEMLEDGKRVQFAGFGQTSGPLNSGNSDDYPEQMQLVENRIVPQEICNRGNDSSYFGPTREMVCTRLRCGRGRRRGNQSIEEEFKQACPGDSGSGVVQFFDEDNVFYLLSVISFIITPKNEDCGHSIKPTISINARYHRDFIYQDDFSSEEELSSSSVDCRWNQWSQWTQCSKKCGGGRRSRSRSKVREVGDGGRTCVGDDRDEEACNMQICHELIPSPIDCRWEQWSRWTLCSIKCGEKRSRSRNKDIQESNGGRACVGDDREEEVCRVCGPETSSRTIAQTFRNCTANEKCETRETCAYVENKYTEHGKTDSKEQKRNIVKNLKSIICNKPKKAFCCPVTEVVSDDIDTDYDPFGEYLDDDYYEDYNSEPKTSCSVGDHPGFVRNGEFHCMTQGDPIKCYLECERGFSPSNGVAVQCSKNLWSPSLLSLQCVPSVLIATGGASAETTVEVYSTTGQCNYEITGQGYGYRDHTSTMFFNGAVIACGSSYRYLEKDQNNCIEMNSGGNWNLLFSLPEGRSHDFSPVVIRDKLYALGGGPPPFFEPFLKETTSDILENGQWLEGPTFPEPSLSTCAVKISPDTFFLTVYSLDGSFVYQYNVSSKILERKSNMIEERTDHGCTFIETPNGKGVLVAGGRVPSQLDRFGSGSASSEYYDIATDTWEMVGSLNGPKEGIKLAVVGGNRKDIIAVGKRLHGSSVEIYDVKTKSWTAAPYNLIAKRGRQYAGIAEVPHTSFINCIVPEFPEKSAVLNVPSSRPLVIHTINPLLRKQNSNHVLGNDPVVLLVTFQSVSIFDPTSSVFSPTSCQSQMANLPDTYYYSNSFTLNHIPRTGEVLLCGGYDDNTESGKSSCFMLMNNKTFVHHSNMKEGRYTHNSVVVNDKLWIIGGRSRKSSPIISVESLSFTGSSWLTEEKASLKRIRLFSCTVASGENSFVTMGGTDDGEWKAADSPEGNSVNTVSHYDIQTKTWTNLSPMRLKWQNFGCVLLPSSNAQEGKILIAGGFVNGDWQKTSELYDIATDTWETVGNLKYERSGGKVVKAGKKIMIFGGYGSGIPGDPNTNFGSGQHSSIEEFNPNTKTWSVMQSPQFPPPAAAVAIPRSLVGC